MRIGQKVRTPNGFGTIIKVRGIKPPKDRPYFVRLYRPRGMYTDFFYSKDDIKPIKKDIK